jgi:hypothetical protein
VQAQPIMTLRPIGTEFEHRNIVWKVISYAETEPDGELKEVVTAIREKKV